VPVLTALIRDGNGGSEMKGEKWKIGRKGRKGKKGRKDYATLLYFKREKRK